MTMMIDIWWLLPAAWIGAAVGYAAAAMCAAAKRTDEEMMDE